MKRISNKRKFCAVCVSALLIQVLVAQNSTEAPIWGQQLVLAQPDGTMVKCRVFGDEFYSRFESIGGYTVTRDSKTGWFVYASLSGDGERLVSTAVPYTGIDDPGALSALGLEPGLMISKEARLQKVLESKKRLGVNGATRMPPPETSGDIVGLTLLIDFSDCEATIPRQDLDDLMNKEGFDKFDNFGSVHDYFFDVSAEKLSYTNVVADYYRAEYPKSWYLDDEVGGKKLDELIQSALENLEALGFDFSTLTITKFYSIQAVNILYAGNPDTEIGVGLWPHMGMHSGFEADGVHSEFYQISNIGDSPAIGVICHENGHMVARYPDLYDYGRESYGLGLYGLMSHGGGSIAAGPSRNPVPPNPYYRHMSGWDVVTDLREAGPGYYEHKSNTNTSYIFTSPNNSREFFYIESRNKVGRSTLLPDEGLLIWHVDEEGSNEYEQMTPWEHYKVSVEQADFLFDLENNVNTGDENDLFSADYNDEFGDETEPDALFWNGDASGLHIHSISEVIPQMNFMYEFIEEPDTDTDTGQEPDAGDDTDTETGTDSDTDSDTDTDTGDDIVGGGESGCGCRSVTTRTQSLLTLLTFLWYDLF